MYYCLFYIFSNLTSNPGTTDSHEKANPAGPLLWVRAEVTSPYQGTHHAANRTALCSGIMRLSTWEKRKSTALREPEGWAKFCSRAPRWAQSVCQPGRAPFTSLQTWPLFLMLQTCSPLAQISKWEGLSPWESDNKNNTNKSGLSWCWHDRFGDAGLDHKLGENECQECYQSINHSFWWSVGCLGEQASELTGVSGLWGLEFLKRVKPGKVGEQAPKWSRVPLRAGNLTLQKEWERGTKRKAEEPVTCSCLFKKPRVKSKKREWRSLPCLSFYYPSPKIQNSESYYYMTKWSQKGFHWLA